MQTRRTFCGLAAGALFAEPGRRLRVGVVGGGFGASFQFHEHPNATVAAVADLRPERRDRLAKTYGCSTTYNSLAELLRDRGVEAVALFTPAPEHVRHSLECLEAGRHVLCAVPAATSLEQCERLVEGVKRSGLVWMMAETSYFQQMTISARKFYGEGAFGTLYACESEYHHAGLDVLFTEGGRRTWRYGYPPMLYPTHCTAHLVGVTKERLTEVTCIGWGDDDPVLRDNVYGNPFWNETALFRTSRGTSFRVAVWWKGAHRGTERAQWFGTKMSLFSAHPNGMGPAVVRWSTSTEKDSAGFARQESTLERYPEPRWWATEMLPPALRHDSGHEGSHPFITHEFVSAVLGGRRPAVDVYEAVAYTAPGIVAHASALKNGMQMRVPSFDRV